MIYKFDKLGGEIMGEKVVALLGGDKRELALLAALKSAGFSMRVYGLPAASLPGGVMSFASPAEAVRGAELLLLPLPGVSENGRLHAPFAPQTILDETVLAGMPPQTPVMVGVASAYLRGLCERCGLRLCEVAELDEVAIPNAVPTAEGALLATMQETDITIDGMRALVLGFGRVGEALAARLRALGAEVIVSNRGAARFAGAARQGYAIYPWGSLEDILPKCDVVYNTVPAPVLDRTKLLMLQRDALVIDLASGSGGTDFAAAADIGIKALHLLSLPGKVAPVSAGRLLGRVYPHIINGLLAEQGAAQERTVKP